MNRKDVLTKAIAALTIIGGICLSIVFVSALGPRAKARSNVINVSLSSITPGQVVLVGTNLPVYIVSPTNEMLSDLDYLTDHVRQRRISTEYRASNGDTYFIFYGVRNDFPSCLPKLYRKDEPNTYRSDNATWLGGFWDVCRDISYDYAGRVIKDIQYAYINFSANVSNLLPVTDASDDGEHLFIQGEGISSRLVACYKARTDSFPRILRPVRRLGGGWPSLERWVSILE